LFAGPVPYGGTKQCAESSFLSPQTKLQWRSIEISTGNKCSDDETAAAGSYLADNDKEKEGKCFPSEFTFSVCLIFSCGGVYEKSILKHVKAGRIQFGTSR